MAAGARITSSSPTSGSRLREPIRSTRCELARLSRPIQEELRASPLAPASENHWRASSARVDPRGTCSPSPDVARAAALETLPLRVKVRSRDFAPRLVGANGGEARGAPRWLTPPRYCPGHRPPSCLPPGHEHRHRRIRHPAVVDRPSAQASADERRSSTSVPVLRSSAGLTC
jgi:hypothetical protein